MGKSLGLTDSQASMSHSPLSYVPTNDSRKQSLYQAERYRRRVLSGTCEQGGGKTTAAPRHVLFSARVNPPAAFERSQGQLKNNSRNDAHIL